MTAQDQSNGNKFTSISNIFFRIYMFSSQSYRLWSDRWAETPFLSESRL